MIRYFLFCLFVLLLALILQQWIPSFGNSLYQSRILLVPLVFFCIAHTQNYIATLILALITGCLWDLEHTLAPFHSNPAIAEYSVDNLRFGYSVFLFGFLGFSIKFSQANINYVGLGFYTIKTFIIFLIYLLLENLFILFFRGMDVVSYDLLYQILLISAFSSLLAPFILLLLDKIWGKSHPRKKSLVQGLNTFIKRQYK